MQYDALSRHTVKITLSEEELREYSLCSESITLRTAETKRGLARLLRRMKLFSGYKSDRLFLEAFPRESGGCILYVSSLPGSEYAGKAAASELREVMCAVESLSLLIRLCAGLEPLCENADSRAYFCESGYYLVLCADKRGAEAAKRLMREYGSVTADPVGIRSAAEHGRLICGENAVSTLAALA